MADEEKTESSDVGGAFSDVAIKLITAAGTTAGVLTIIAGTGAAISWARFSAAGLPGDQALVALTRKELIAAGAMTLALFVLLALIAVALVFAIDGHGRATDRMRVGIFAVAGAEIAAMPWLVDAGSPEALDHRAVLGIVMVVMTLALLVGTELYERRREKRGDAGSAPATAARTSVRTTTVTDRRRPLSRIWTRTVTTTEPAATEPPNPPEPAIPRVLALVAAGLGAAVVALLAWWLHGEIAIVVGVLVAAVLGAICFGIADQSRDRFWPYGLSVFFSVLLFGACFSVPRIFESPQVAPVALLRAAEGKATRPIVGLLVANGKDELWLGAASSFCEDGKPTDRGKQGRGAMFRIPAEDVVELEIGALMSLKGAEQQAQRLMREVLARQTPRGRGRVEASGDPVGPPAVGDCKTSGQGRVAP